MHGLSRRMQYQHRYLEDTLKRALQQYQRVGVKGPLGAGKTTLLVNALPDYEYVTFADHRSLQQYREDPRRFLRLYQRNTIFDEIQLVPELIQALAEQPLERSTHYVISASCLFQAIKQIDITALNGVKMLSLLGYQHTELPLESREQAIYHGSFPALIEIPSNNRGQWFTTYLENSVLKNLPVIGQVSDQQEFLRLLHLLAAHTAEALNLSRYAQTLGVDVKTIKRWIDLLAASMIIFLIPPYHDDFGKRAIKSPKLYFYDTGLAAYLTGTDTQQQYEFGPMASRLYENYIVLEVLKKICNQDLPAKLYYFSTNHGVAVELIIEFDDKRHFITIQKNETFRIRMINAMEKFMTPQDQGFLLYNGINMPYRNNIQVMHFSTYLHTT